MIPMMPTAPSGSGILPLAHMHRVCPGPPNQYDACLANASYLTGRYASARYDPVYNASAWVFGAPPWVTMPRAGQRYQKVASSVLPGVEGVDGLLLTYRIPFGYDGVLLTVTCLFTGTGFVEGSGDLHWRVRNNYRYFQDLGDIRISLGSLELPYALEGGGYRLYSNETLRFYVQLGAGALATLDPNGRIVVGMTGWVYPHSEYLRYTRRV